MSDLINRQDAIKAVYELFDVYDGKINSYPTNIEQIDECINQIASVNPQEPKWIPVSKRLPEERSRILVCCNDGYIGVDDYFSYGFDDCKDDVIAWMPLPEPYKAESEDKE